MPTLTNIVFKKFQKLQSFSQHANINLKKGENFEQTCLLLCLCMKTSAQKKSKFIHWEHKYKIEYIMDLVIASFNVSNECSTSALCQMSLGVIEQSLALPCNCKNKLVFLFLKTV